MTSLETAEPSGRLFIGRQPILDAHEKLFGYELFFRDSALNQAHEISPGRATADVVCNAFTELGLAGVLGGQKAFIIADPEFIQHEAIGALPAKDVVLEIDVSHAGNPRFVDHCQMLKQSGLSCCLNMNGFVGLDSGTAALIGLVDYLKLNIKAFDDITLKKLLDLPIQNHPLAVASHVETKTDHQRGLDIGFHYFQGFYFAEPKLVEGKRLDTSIHGLIHILHLLNQDVSLAEIEQAFKAEAALTIKLLRLTNSVGVGLAVRVSSVRHAISIIGRRQIQRWLQLLMFSQGGNADIERNPLMQLAAFKGNFMERLASRCFPQLPSLPDLAFLAGLMSLMPAALGMPMEIILEQIDVAPQLGQALTRRSGELGVLLDLTDSYDNDDCAGADRALFLLGNRISRETLNRCLADSMAWVQQLMVDGE